MYQKFHGYISDPILYFSQFPNFPVTGKGGRTAFLHSPLARGLLADALVLLVRAARGAVSER